MRNISRGEATKSRLVEHNDTQKRQKHQSNEKQYIEAGTESFLARDICGPSRTRTNVKNQLQLKTTAVEEKMERVFSGTRVRVL
ncbi:hypothetical protein Scep_023598 [Stephania cephalantha]|uniref:Uncharacterized protein n=1 Tax=Stephania cephalantha TaxID=152367 RepID=A0AAP0HSX8_9MAGN